MAKPKYTTFTGIKAEEIPAKLAEHFPPQAYKEVPGGAKLTDINTGFMIERLTEVFGPRGLGWNLVYDPASINVGDGSRPLARLDATFVYYLWGDDGARIDCPILTSGVNQNDEKYVEEGARTAAIGGALKWLCFQNDIYKNTWNHNDARRESQGNPTGNKPATTGSKSPEITIPESWTPEAAAEVVTPKKTKIGSLTTDDLKRFVTGVDVATKEGKPEASDPALKLAYSAAKFLISHNEAQAPAQA
jgi:hypothetical protein